MRSTTSLRSTTSWSIAIMLALQSSGAFAQQADAPSGGGGLGLSADASASADGSGVQAQADAEGQGDAQTQQQPAGEASTAGEQPSGSSVPAYAGARATRDQDAVATPAQRFVTIPYMKRYIPENNLWEVGLFLGGFFPASDHNLKVPALPREEYSGGAFELGARLGYYPLSFLGFEAEGMTAAGSTALSDRSAVFYGARGQLVAQLPLASVVPFVTVGGGAVGAVSEPMGHDGDPSFHFGLGAKAAINHILGLRLDLRDNLAQKGQAEQGALTHHFELQLGVNFTFERTAPAAVPRVDQDYDGLYDDEDRCPTQGALTADGCPRDRDGDGIADLDDACPAEAGDPPDGCPNKDLDGDGVPIPADQCPEEAGEPPSGCPDRDLDGDGIIEGDQCPEKPETRNGFQDADGCPDEMPEAVKRFAGVIRGINFKQGTAEIEEASHVTLDSAVEILDKHQSLRIEVSGHTSSEGTDERNQELSEQRAAAVAKYLVDHGIDSDRIKTRGAGSSEPIADNETREGRRENRRIEFRILAQP